MSGPNQHAPACDAFADAPASIFAKMDIGTLRKFEVAPKFWTGS